MDWNYISERVNRYNNEPSDDLLYRLGTHVDVFSPEDCHLIKQQAGNLHPEQRYRILDWIVQAGLEIECDLALLIFGRHQLEEWLKRSRQAYPDFEFFLSFEYLTKFQSGCDDGICFTMHWTPNPGAPEPDVECDFPWKPYWESGEMFWGEYPGGTTNQFDFNLSCYPNQWSFATPNSFCEEGSRYTMVDERDADLMSVAQVLEHFAVAV